MRRRRKKYIVIFQMQFRDTESFLEIRCDGVDETNGVVFMGEGVGGGRMIDRETRTFPKERMRARTVR